MWNNLNSPSLSSYQKCSNSPNTLVPPLYSLQQVHVLCRRPRVFQVGSHLSGAEGQNSPFLLPTGLRMQPSTHPWGISSLPHQLPQVPLPRAALDLFFPSLDWSQGLPQPRCTTVPWVLLSLLRFPWATSWACPGVALDGLVLISVSLHPKLGVTKPAEGALDPFIYAINGDTKHWSQYGSLRDSSHCCPSGVWLLTTALWMWPSNQFETYN